jgi:hypothetical protein
MTQCHDIVHCDIRLSTPYRTVRTRRQRRLNADSRVNAGHTYCQLIIIYYVFRVSTRISIEVTTLDARSCKKVYYLFISVI